MDNDGSEDFSGCIYLKSFKAHTCCLIELMAFVVESKCFLVHVVLSWLSRCGDRNTLCTYVNIWLMDRPEV